jgi:hypothetical protein
VQRFPLAAIAGDIGAELLQDQLAAVAPSERVVQTDSGVEHRYDALVLGIGGRIRARYEHAITLEDTRSKELLRGLIEDVERGYVRRLAFVVPPRMAWPLPIYELALFTAKRASEMRVELAVTLLTPEDAPLGVLGDGVSRGVSELLADRGIEVIASAYCEVPEIGQVEIASGNRRLEVDRVVALPELYGPDVPGLPEAPDGFIPVDFHCQVRGVERAGGARAVSPGDPRHAADRRSPALPERWLHRPTPLQLGGHRAAEMVSAGQDLRQIPCAVSRRHIWIWPGQTRANNVSSARRQVPRAPRVHAVQNNLVASASG